MSKEEQKRRKSLRESIAKLEDELSVAKTEGNAQRIMSLEKVIKCLESRLKTS